LEHGLAGLVVGWRATSANRHGQRWAASRIATWLALAASVRARFVQPASTRYSERRQRTAADSTARFADVHQGSIRQELGWLSESATPPSAASCRCIRCRPGLPEFRSSLWARAIRALDHGGRVRSLPVQRDPAQPRVGPVLRGFAPVAPDHETPHDLPPFADPFLSAALVNYPQSLACWADSRLPVCERRY
jgi:hypothetical protein